MKIAICEDETVFSEALSESIRTYFSQSNSTVQIDLYQSAGDFLGAETLPDILFTDIYMPDIDGVSLCRILKERGEQFPVIFTTVSADHAIDAFDLGALHYLVKPCSDEKVFLALDRCMEFLKRKPGRILEIRSGGAMVPVT